MATQLDGKFMYLRFEHGLTETQINDLVNEVIASNEEKLANSSNKDDLLYDLVVNRLTETTREAETTKEIDTNSNRKEFGIMLISHPDILSGIDGSTYNTYATMMANSNFECATIDDGTLEEYWNYIRKRGAKQVIIDFMNEASKEFEGGKVPAPRTVERHIKKMLENNIPLAKVENVNGKVYYRLLNHIGKGYYRLIPYEKVRELVISTNSNMLKLYVYMNYLCDQEHYKQVDRKHLAEKLGLSTVSDNNLKTIGIMLTSLCNLGFLERLEEAQISNNGNTYKTIHSYRITTLDEYRQAKKRGTISKK